jgi:hypothetical protein
MAPASGVTCITANRNGQACGIAVYSGAQELLRSTRDLAIAAAAETGRG